MELTQEQRKSFKMQAHSLKPVVSIGGKGLTDAVIAELEIAFKAHELIKVKIAADRDERKVIYAKIASDLNAFGVQLIGQMGVFYKQN